MLKIKNKTEIFSFNLSVSLKYKIKDLIEYSIDKFNEVFLKYSLPFKLNNDSSLYSIKPSKKNGEPKADLPSKTLFLTVGFHPDVQLCDCSSENFTLINKKISDSLDNFLVEKEKKNNFKCLNCLVF